MLKYYFYLWCFFITGIYLCSVTKKDSPRIPIKDVVQLKQVIEDFKKEKLQSRTASTTTTPHQSSSSHNHNHQASSEEDN